MNHHSAHSQSWDGQSMHSVTYKHQYTNCQCPPECPLHLSLSPQMGLHSLKSELNPAVLEPGRHDPVDPLRLLLGQNVLPPPNLALVHYGRDPAIFLRLLFRSREADRIRHRLHLFPAHVITQKGRHLLDALGGITNNVLFQKGMRFKCAVSDHTKS